MMRLEELRRNPEQNQRISINQKIKDAMASAGKLSDGTINCFVSFTAIDKLGINPSSEFNTPLGIYAYPAEYVIGHVGENGSMMDLPFAGEQKYANIFSINENGIVNLATIGASEIGRLISEIDKIASQYITPNQLSIIKNTKRGSDGSTLVHHLYDIARYASFNYEEEGKDPGANAFQTKIYRKLGINGLIDFNPKTGQGIGAIHGNEPTQAVFFSKSVIKQLNREHNKDSNYERMKKTDVPGMLEQVKSGEMTLRDFFHAIPTTVRPRMLPNILKMFGYGDQVKEYVGLIVEEMGVNILAPGLRAMLKTGKFTAANFRELMEYIGYDYYDFEYAFREGQVDDLLKLFSDDAEHHVG